LSHEQYSKIIKPEMKIAIFDIGGGSCICRIYEISENEGKLYGTCFRELNTDTGKFSGRDIDDIIIMKIKKSIPRDFRNNVRIRILKAAKKIKHDLSVLEKTELDLSEIHPSLEGCIEFTREWFEKELGSYFKDYYFRYYYYKLYPHPKQNKLRRVPERADFWHCPIRTVDLVFLTGGTCRIPLVQKWVGNQFPNAECVIDGELEIITASGAIIHGLQVLSGEVKPCIKFEKYQADQYNFKNEESDEDVDEKNSSSDYDSHLENDSSSNDNSSTEEEIAEHEYQSETKCYNDEKESNFVHNTPPEKEPIVDQEKTKVSPELKKFKMEKNERDACEFNSPSYITESCTWISDKRECNPSKSSVCDTINAIKDDQVAINSTINVENFEVNKCQSNITLEPPQETSIEKKSLPSE